jgi:hypothetical protein
VYAQRRDVFLLLVSIGDLLFPRISTVEARIPSQQNYLALCISWGRRGRLSNVLGKAHEDQNLLSHVH